MSLPFDPSQFHDEVLQPSKIDTVFGVPDSSLSGLLSFFAATMQAPQHIVTANEGGAVALASGYHLATGKVALCYLQNSGVSNALSPLQSLASSAVAGIPMLLMVGWRGKPGIKDEPQHALIGPQLLENLAANKIAYELMPETLDAARDVVARLVARAVADKTPVALVVTPGTFKPFKAAADTTDVARNSQPLSSNGNTEVAGVKMWLSKGSDPSQPLTRESVVRRVMQRLNNRDRGDVVVTSLGGTSREAYMCLQENGDGVEAVTQNRRIFFVLGAMGHAFAVACGIRLGLSGLKKQQSSTVYCLDGDGSFLMHVGNNAVLADVGPKGLVHVVVHNGVHSSTGDQPLSLTLQAYMGLAAGMPYAHKIFVDDAQALDRAMNLAADMTADGGVSVLIFVLVKPGQSSQLPRPSETASELKKFFMQSIE
ncbi:phosphonopyruvate decarboxylase [Microdochium nivale]|nr:phosphonopyruvate decarboxylase [Microdochium nivale]